MPKILEEPITAIQLRLFTKDLRYLQRKYSTSIGVNEVIRTIVRTYVDELKLEESETNQVEEY